VYDGILAQKISNVTFLDWGPNYKSDRRLRKNDTDFFFYRQDSQRVETYGELFSYLNKEVTTLDGIKFDTIGIRNKYKFQKETAFPDDQRREIFNITI
jgi:hypothetical protein